MALAFGVGYVLGGGLLSKTTGRLVGAGIGLEYDFENNIAARLGVDINNFYSDDLYLGAIYKF